MSQRPSVIIESRTSAWPRLKPWRARGDDRIGVILDRAHALDHRLHPAAADHVHGRPAHALRNPREDDDLTGTVLVEPRLDHGAEEKLADVVRLDVRPADRLPHREGT